VCRYPSLSILCFVAVLPPTSTLFPYTTLFRSSVRDPLRGRARALFGRLRGSRDGSGPLRPVRTSLREPRARSRNLQRRRLRHRLDRKSTRLNSSHVKISYAVFCLKKKIRTKQNRSTSTHYQRSISTSG